MIPSFLFYLLLFGFSIAVLCRSIFYHHSDNIAASVILAAYTLLALFLHLSWSDLSNPFGNVFRSGNP